MEKAKEIIRKEQGDKVVLDFVPKEFPLVITPQTKDFKSAQDEQTSDFKISDLVAKQIGLNKLERQSIEAKIEEMALEKLKVIEENAYKEAYDLGLIEGSEKAFEERKVEFDDQLKQLDVLLDEFQNIKQRLLMENEGTFVRLLTHLAEKIAMKEIEIDEAAVVEVLKSVVDQIQSADHITVRVSHDDLFFIESYREKAGSKFEFLDRLKLEGADNIDSGGCIVETSSGSIDATLKQRVSKAWEAIEARIPRYKSKAGSEESTQDDGNVDVFAQGEEVVDTKSDDDDGSEENS